MPTAPDAVILLAVYNGEPFLAEQLESLLAQSVRCDILIRDDGSSDQSARIIDQFVAAYPQIHRLDDTTGTPGPANNFSTLLFAALANAAYQWFFFCDQDDIWTEDKVKVQLGLGREHPPDVPLCIHSDLGVVDSELKPVAESFSRYQGLQPERATVANLLVENVVTGCTMLINRKLAEQVNPLPAGVIMHDWWIALLAACAGRLLWIPEPLVKYRQHSANVLGAQSVEHVSLLRRLIKNRSRTPHRYYRQAQMLLERLTSSTLDNTELNVVRAFVDSESATPFRRVSVANRFGIRKHNTIKHGLLLAALFFHRKRNSNAD